MRLEKVMRPLRDKKLNLQYQLTLTESNKDIIQIQLDLVQEVIDLIYDELLKK